MLGRPLGLASGWDEGELILHGFYDGRRWDRTANASDDEMPKAAHPDHIDAEPAEKNRTSHCRIGNLEGVALGELFADLELNEDRIVASAGTLPDYREDHRGFALVSPGLRSVLAGATGEVAWRPATLVDAEGNELDWYLLEMPEREIVGRYPRFMAPIDPPSFDVTIDNTWSFQRLVVTRAVSDRIEAGGFKGFGIYKAVINEEPSTP